MHRGDRPDGRAEVRDQQHFGIAGADFLKDVRRSIGLQMIEHRGLDPHDQAFAGWNGRALLDLLCLDIEFLHACQRAHDVDAFRQGSSGDAAEDGHHTDVPGLDAGDRVDRGYAKQQ